MPHAFEVEKYGVTPLKKTAEKLPPLPTNPLTLPADLSAMKFGADPELFVKNDKGEFVCADMIPGTKDEPCKVKYGAVQRDGFAAEYNIDPVSTFEEWNRNHKAVQGQLQSMLPKGYTLVATPSVRFSPEVFDAAPDCAKELGCSPDWDAWRAALNPPPETSGDPYLRCIGGHIHFGWGENLDTTDRQHMMNCFDLVKQLDFFLGAWALKHDKDTDRRSLYGKAGSCRIKNYGVEYRTLSSFWVLDKQLRLDVWNRMVQAVKSISKFFCPDNYRQDYSELLIHCINIGKLSPTLSKACTFPLNQIHLPSLGI
jgi:hypothetical protein